MKRISSLVLRVVVVALLLLTIGGGVANAETPVGGAFGTTSLPDDPGYDFSQ